MELCLCGYLLLGLLKDNVLAFSRVSIWSSVGMLYVHGHLFRLGKFSSIILLKIFTGPLSWDSSLCFSHCVLDFLDVLG